MSTESASKIDPAPPADTASPGTPATTKGNVSPDKEKDPITVVLAGKSGAGKSSLIKNVFGKKLDTKMSPSAKTSKLNEYFAVKRDITQNNVTIHIVDTIGYVEDKKEQQLVKLSEYIHGEADLLLYCLPIGPGSRFDDHNPDIMRSLQDAFGKNIWKHCMVVLTFSNLAWNHACRESKEESGEVDEEAATTEYKEYIKEYIKRFKKELDKLEVKNVNVISVLDDNFSTNTSNANNKTSTIVFIPAGFEAKDKVLPGLEYKLSPAPDTTPERKNTTQEDPDSTDKWMDVLVYEMIRRSTHKGQRALLEFWGLKAKVGHAIGGGVVGGTVGGVITGAVAGAVMGSVAGPVGTVIGASLGTVGGGIVGTLAGGGGSTAISHAKSKYEEKTKKKISREEQRRAGREEQRRASSDEEKARKSASGKEEKARS